MAQADDDVYRVLGVPHDADEEAVKSAFRAIAHENHPDRRPGDAAAAARFDEANRAYAQWLQATGQRPAPPAGEQGAAFANVEDVFAQFGDLFGEFFGAARDKGADLKTSIELTEAEAQRGCKRDIEVMRACVCSECAGAGGFGDQKVCKDCAGTGKRSTQQGFFTVEAVCATCSGTKRWSTVCPGCERGLVRSAQKLAVVVPPGIQRGQVLRIAGKGDERAGKPSGHLYVAIVIDGQTAEGAAKLGTPRERGHDVVVDVAVRTRHLLFGGSLEVPTPDGSATVHVPRSVEDGREIRLAGRGKARAASGPAPTAGDPYRDVGRGDLIVVLRVPPAVQKQREVLGFSALISIVLAILVALSMR